VLVASTGLLSGALGAGIARLVADPSVAVGVASAGPRMSAESPSAYLAIAHLAAGTQEATYPDSGASRETTPTARVGTGRKSPGESRPPPDADVDRAITGASVTPEPATRAEPSQSGQGGASKPSAGSSPGAPADDEEPSEEGSGDDDDDEEDEEEGPGDDDDDEEDEEDDD
jgi:hypothetical protein